MEKGIELAKGEYIWIAESDDWADLTFLDVLIDIFKKRKNLNIAYTQSYKVNSEGSVIGDWLFHTDDLDEALFRNDFEMNGVLYIEKFLIKKNVIPNASGVIFRNKPYTADEEIEKCSDWLMWLKILLDGDVYYVSKKLNYFRQHHFSVIAIALNDKKKSSYEYDFKMRIKFKSYLSLNGNNNSIECIKLMNNKYIVQNKKDNIIYLANNNFYFLSIKECAKYFSYNGMVKILFGVFYKCGRFYYNKVISIIANL